MEDTLLCPICSHKLRSLKRDAQVYNLQGTFYERICTRANHSLVIFSNAETGQINILRFSLDPKYTRYFEINFVTQSCRVICFKLSETKHTIDIPKMIEPDFPNLEKLKEKISMYVTFS